MRTTGGLTLHESLTGNSNSKDARIGLYAEDGIQRQSQDVAVIQVHVEFYTHQDSQQVPIPAAPNPNYQNAKQLTLLSHNGTA
uniref:Uncharacterized protein n=1 Tax=Physcomitrium patens TaxID=3218 RepID=A0A2K1IM23_PHYPA|nr:hypothetical protein PHYPA_026641 [Physcomitrium patens]